MHFAFCILHSEFSILHLIKPRRQSDKYIVIVGLATLERRLVAYRLAASVTAVDDYISLLWVGQSLYGSENSLTVVSPISRVYIHVQRTKTEWTVVP